MNNNSADDSALLRAHFILSIGGTFCARIWTSIVALTLALLHWKSLCYVIRFRQMITTIALILSIVTFILVIVLFNAPVNVVDIDPNFKIGSYQAYIVIAILVPSLLITLTSIVVTQKFHSSKSSSIHLSEVNAGSSHSINGDSRHRSLISTTSDIPYPRRTLTPKRIRRQMDPQPRIHRTSAASINVEDALQVLSVPNDRCSSDPGCGCHAACDARVKKYQEDACHVVTAASGRCRETEDRRILPVLDETQPLLIESQDDPETERSCCEAITSSDFHQVSSHLMLLMALFFSMMIGLIVAVGKMWTEKSTGVFLALEYLDVFFNYGQGIVTFLLFGFDIYGIKSVFKAILRRSRPLNRDVSSHKLRLPSLDDLSRETIQINTQFVDYHQDKCRGDICYQIEINSIPVTVFKGFDLVDWLLNAGLAGDRKNAVIYGKHLIYGRTIQHLHSQQTFHDSAHLYKFLINTFYESQEPSSSFDDQNDGIETIE